MKRFLLYFVMIAFLAVPMSAVWAPLSQSYIGPNNNVLAEGFNIRILDIDVEGEAATVRITDSGRQVFQGEVTTSAGYEREGVLRVRADAFRYKDSAHPEVRLAVYRWDSVAIETINHPEEMYKNDAYKVWVRLENPESQPRTYIVRASVDGMANIKPSTADESPRFQSTFRDISAAAEQEITLKAGEKKKSYFIMQPIGRDREGTDVILGFDVLTTRGELLESVEPKSISITSSQILYIEDIIAPSGMLSGAENNIVVKVRNSYLAASNDVRLRLSAPEFDVIGEEMKHLRILASETQSIEYKVTPFGGGVFTIEAELSLDRTVRDTLAVEVPVLGPKVYAITEIESPEELKPGEKGIVFVTVRNRGNVKKSLSLLLESDDFTIEPSEAVIELSTSSETRALFNIRSTTDEKTGKFTVGLYDQPGDFKTRTYQKQDKLTDSRSVAVKISRPQVIIERTDDGEIVEVIEDEEPVEVDVDVTEEDEEPEMEPEPEPEMESFSLDDLEGLWPYISIGLLVMLAIVLIIIGEKKRNRPEMEFYD